MTPSDRFRQSLVLEWFLGSPWYQLAPTRDIPIGNDSENHRLRRELNLSMEPMSNAFALQALVVLFRFPTLEPSCNTLSPSSLCFDRRTLPLSDQPCAV